MAARTKRPEPQTAKLRARIEELELRVKLLEARVRSGLVQGRRPVDEVRVRSAQARRSRPRPRCGGCHLELPPGRRGESCVWCGFQLDAVAATFRGK